MPAADSSGSGGVDRMKKQEQNKGRVCRFPDLRFREAKFRKPERHDD